MTDSWDERATLRTCKSIPPLRSLPERSPVCPVEDVWNTSRKFELRFPNKHQRRVVSSRGQTCLKSPEGKFVLFLLLISRFGCFVSCVTLFWAEVHTESQGRVTCFLMHSFCPQLNFPSQGANSDASWQEVHPNLHPLYLRSHARLNLPINPSKNGQRRGLPHGMEHKVCCIINRLTLRRADMRD